MSDAPSGPDWWQASDGKWYPPAPPATRPRPAPPVMVQQPQQQPTAGNSAAGKRIGVAGAVAVIIGSLGPWATATAPFVGTLSVNGTEGDGVLFLGAAVVAGLAVLGGGGWAALAGLCGVAMTIGAVYELVNVNEAVGEASGTALVAAGVGWGLWLVLVGAIAVAAGSLATYALDNGNS